MSGVLTERLGSKENKVWVVFFANFCSFMRNPFYPQVVEHLIPCEYASVVLAQSPNVIQSGFWTESNVFLSSILFSLWRGPWKKIWLCFNRGSSLWNQFIRPSKTSPFDDVDIFGSSYVRLNDWKLQRLIWLSIRSNSRRPSLTVIGPLFTLTALICYTWSWNKWSWVT